MWKKKYRTKNRRAYVEEPQGGGSLQCIKPKKESASPTTASTPKSRAHDERVGIAKNEKAWGGRGVPMEGGRSQGGGENEEDRILEKRKSSRKAKAVAHS